MNHPIYNPPKSVKIMNYILNASNSFPLPDALEDGAEQVGGVEAREADEEQVERVPHLLPRDDDRGDRVAHDPEDGERRLQEE